MKLKAILLSTITAIQCIFCLSIHGQNLSATGQKMKAMGLVNIAEADPTIAIDLKYTKADNFVGKVLYTDLREAFLHPDALKLLLKAQKLLKEKHPNYSLIIYDAARPMSVQKQMWSMVKGTKKQKYVSNPARGGGMHNYGLAVDISIIDATGNPLPMGTEFDHLGYEANITNEVGLVKSGKITEAERQNRLLLRKVMKQAGFRPLSSEWWHFNFCTRQYAKAHYKPIP